MKISQCRLCHSYHYSKIIDLGSHPLADTFVTDEKLSKSDNYYPLQLGQCHDCGHVFTMFKVSSIERYQKNDYSYESSNSQISIKHFLDFSKSSINYKNFSKNISILEIGSNVGTLLEHFSNHGFKNTEGIEPAKNIAQLARKRGIKTINDFFGLPDQKHFNDSSFDLIVCSNVMNHIDDLDSFFQTLKLILKEDGVFIFEVPYLLDLINRVAFDTIYHEHVHYFSIKSLSKILSQFGFVITKIETLDYMCGSIRVYTEKSSIQGNCIDNFIKNEENSGLFNLSTYQSFMEQILYLRSEVSNYLTKIKQSGGMIIGIGAAAKGNTFLNFCGLNANNLAFITDSSELKIGKYTPGSRILIISDNDIPKHTTHALILPWNIADYLKTKLSHLNLTFYTPLIKSDKGFENENN